MLTAVRADRRPRMPDHGLMLAIVLVFLAACSASDVQPADTVYIDGRVYTVNASNNWAEAVAVRDGKIVAVGSTEQISAFRGPGTTVSDLQGRMLMPGIHDMHIHTTEGGMKERFECGFGASLRIPEIIEKVADCAVATSSGEWIRGGGWATVSGWRLQQLQLPRHRDAGGAGEDAAVRELAVKR